MGLVDFFYLCRHLKSFFRGFREYNKKRYNETIYYLSYDVALGWAHRL